MDLDSSSALPAVSASVGRQPEASGSNPGPIRDSTGSSGEVKKKERGPRVVRACDGCRKRKARCTGGQPCPVCVNAKRPCTYEPPKRGPPKTYVEALEQRLEAMEGLLRSISASAGVDEIGALLDTVDDDEKTQALEQAVEVLTARHRTENGIRTPGDTSPTGLDDILPSTPCTAMPLAHSFGQTENNMSLETDRFVGASSGPAFAKNLLLKLVGPHIHPLVHHDPTPSLVDTILQNDSASRARSFQLPPADLSAQLILAYFAHVNELMPILHRPSFERALAAGMLESDASFRRLVLMVFALGARFHKDPRIPISPLVASANPAVREHAAGFEMFRAATGDMASHLTTATLFDIQNSVLAVIYCLGATTPLTAWQRVGFAIRRAVDVGAHSEARTRWTTSPLEDQLRKRAFHTLFTLDRTISSQLGRPLAMQDFECDLSYPLDISDEALDDWNLRGSQSPPPLPSTAPTPMAPWLLLMKLLKIHARTLRTLYGTTQVVESVKEISACVLDLDSQLNEWLGSVPPHLRWDASALDPRHLSASAMLYTSYYYSQILVYRDLITPRHNVQLPFPSITICSNAARSCVHVLDTLRQRGKIEDNFWHAPLFAATAGMILTILLIRQGPAGMADPASAVAADARRCIAVLDALAPSTCMAMKISKVITKLMGIAKMHNERVKPPSAFARDVMGQGNGYDCISVAVRYAHGDDAAPLEKPAFVAPSRTTLPQLPIDPILALSPVPELSPPPPLEFSSSSDSSSLHSNQSYSLPPASYGTYADPMFAGVPLDSPSSVPAYQPWDIQDFSMVNTDEGEWASTFGTSFDFFSQSLGAGV